MYFVVNSSHFLRRYDKKIYSCFFSINVSACDKWPEKDSKKKSLFEEKKCPAGLLYSMGKYDCLQHVDGSQSMASSPLSNTVEVGPAHMPCGQKVTEKDCKD